MKLIIDIDESLYNRVKEKIVALSDIPVLCKAVDDSTPYNPTGDCISREDLKKALDKKALDLANGGMIFIESINRIIDNAQAVESERPQGKWELHGMIYYCSECGHDCGESGDNFCGNCGAEMRGGAK